MKHNGDFSVMPVMILEMKYTNCLLISPSLLVELIICHNSYAILRTEKQ
jgi:hypothetical protein